MSIAYSIRNERIMTASTIKFYQLLLLAENEALLLKKKINSKKNSTSKDILELFEPSIFNNYSSVFTPNFIFEFELFICRLSSS